MEKKLEKKFKYENAACKAAGLICTCNACDRCLYEDEIYYPGGYCFECHSECEHIETLQAEYNVWLIQNNLPKMSACDLLHDHEKYSLTDEQKQYLQNFIKIWDNE